MTGPSDEIAKHFLQEARPAPLVPVPFPADLAPVVLQTGARLPEADVLVVTWTAAEVQALADVLAPGHPSSAWAEYTDDWAAYEPQLTDRSPARESKCLGKWALVQIRSKKVVLFKSDLHMATDAVSLPVVQLWKQLLAVVQPSLVITTGTAGGIGLETELGDVCVTNGAKFNCQDAFKNEAYAQATFKGPAWTPGPHLRGCRPLLEQNAARLKPLAKRVPKITCVLDGPGVETVDYFGFADATDSYGIVANDPHARTEEMDDATLPLALNSATGTYGYLAVAGKIVKAPTPVWLSVRNASDPQVPHMKTLAEEKKWAEQIYEKDDYWTTICSAIATWCVIADM